MIKPNLEYEIDFYYFKIKNWEKFIGVVSEKIFFVFISSEETITIEIGIVAEILPNDWNHYMKPPVYINKKTNSFDEDDNDFFQGSSRNRAMPLPKPELLFKNLK